jgi:DNA-binding transcriptional regulator YhcF (GntR family)
MTISIAIQLNRNLPISLTEQIKGQIKYAIAYGQFNSGDALPSVREMAEQLEVAPMTISRVYRELAEESLVILRPRSGTYVADMAKLNGNANPSFQNLRQMLYTSLCQARLMGHSLEEIKSTFDALITDFEKPSAQRTIILVANFQHTTETYARAIEGIFSDLNISVIPLVINDLKSNFSAYQETIQNARLTITIPTRLNEVRALLEPKYSRVVAVAFHLSKEVRNILAELPANTRLGIVTTYPEFLQPMIEGVHTYSFIKDPPQCAFLDQTKTIQDVVNKIDVLLYASGSEEVLKFLPPTVRAIEFLHSPVPESLNRLRPFLF